MCQLLVDYLISNVSFYTLEIIEKNVLKLSLGEYGRQRTSTKFHDLVLNLRFQNSRVLEIIMFQALFSRRKVFVYHESF